LALRIGHLSTFYHTAILLMADAGTEERLGTGVSWRLFGTGPDIVSAFGRGELDLAYIGLPPAIIGIDRGIQVKCVAGGHVEGTVIAGDGSLKEYPAIEGLGEILGQLKGGKVGVPGRGSIHDVIITECLERLGLRGEVEVCNFPWADLVTEAMARGEVIAVAGTPALAAAVERYARGKILYPPSMLWPDNPSYGIVASAEFLGRAGPQLEGFLALHEQTARYLKASPGEAAARISEYVKVADRDLVLRAIQISPRYCAQLSEEYVSSTMGFVQALGRLGYISRVLSEEEIFEPSFIRKIHPPGSHY
jgi:NitT/TauT family transport system substrate-binding protein